MILINRLSWRKGKKLKERMCNLKSLSNEKLKKRRNATAFVKPLISPRYDNVYLEGLEWLNNS